MPIYDFECPKCHSKEERLVKSDEVDVKCSECGYEKMERLIASPSGFQFKGGGYYCTDFKKPS
jgi:putative FmdB family regulatory protein